MSIKLPDGTIISGGINYKNVLPRTGGTMTGPLTLSGDPTDDLHAVTKQYLEKIVGDIGDMSISEYLDEKFNNINTNCVVNAKTRYEFPSVGNPNTIYKAEVEQLLYQWNPISLRYEVLGATESPGGVLEINLIHGGDAYGVY